MHSKTKTITVFFLVTMGLAGLMLAGCFSAPPEGIAPAKEAKTTVKMDFFHRPLPEIPLPNDVATRYDETSATHRRINASMVAPTQFEAEVRTLLDQLDGWGVFQPISIPFTGPLDVQSILDGHRDKNYDLDNDVIYLVNVDEDSDEWGRFYHLDLGNGNYPVVLEDIDGYWANDPRGHTISLGFEEVNEDKNGNGKLDSGEDTDADGVLDVPNYYPGADPDPDDLAARTDALMTFYEIETNTLLVRALVPLAERTTYAVVITRRLLDADGDPVGSPYPFIHHHSQTEALQSLGSALSDGFYVDDANERVNVDVGISLDDVAFAFTFTTQTIKSNWRAVREGLHGYGVQGQMGKDYPAEVAEFLPLADLNNSIFEDYETPYVVYMDEFMAPLTLIAQAFMGASPTDVGGQKLIGAFEYVDYFVVGAYDSPQLFPRKDDNGDYLGFNLQAWPEDLDREVAPLRSERVYFQAVIPRKEISARGDGKPAPTVIISHGYTGSRFDEALAIGSFLAKHGIASVAIDCVSHGIAVNDDEFQLAMTILDGFGLMPLFDSVVNHDRALDWDKDGYPNSGGDFWTSYLFHTRDVVRQSALDYMQLIRIIRSFDGERTWDFDLNGDGEKDLAGDFDGDGNIDIGGDAIIGITGGSLGGIMSAVLAGVEPDIEVSIPIAGGGGLTDVGLRSLQGGVRESVILRVMGPLYVGTAAASGEPMIVETIVTSVNDDVTLQLATVDGVELGDFVVVENLANGQRGCGYIWQEEGQETLRFRTGVESDVGDLTRIVFYKGDAMLLGSIDCEVKTSAKERHVVSTYEKTVLFEAREFKLGSSIEAMAEGLGLRRANPELRRFLSIGQVVLDPADPAVLAVHAQRDPIHFEGTDQTTGTHMLVVTTVGDMNVPASTGLSIGRAGGYIPFLEDDERYGMPANQKLLETYTAEAVHTLKRYTDSAGNGVHMDVENFSEGTDHWGAEIPRLDPAMRLGYENKDLLGGHSGAIFPFPRPSGQHGFAMPGVLIDEGIEYCESLCEEEEGCACDEQEYFDVGAYMMNMMARYFISGGQELYGDMCMSREDCDFIQESPFAGDEE